MDTLTYQYFADHLEDAAEYLRTEIKTELEQQGYRNYGQLIDSIDISTTVTDRKIVTEIWMMAYWYYVNKHKIWRKDPPPYSALYKWAKKKKSSLDEKELKSFVHAVRAKIKKEGSPMDSSYEFTKNGRRTEFTKYAIDNNLEKVAKLINFTKPIRNIFEQALAPYFKKRA